MANEAKKNQEDEEKPVKNAEEKLPWPDQKLRPYASISQEEYIAERFNSMRGWYDKKAGSTKNLYLRMRAASVIGGAIVPVLINMHFNFIPEILIDLLTTAISLLVVIFVSLESVFHYREQWKNYRSTEQLLATEYFKFVSGEGPYDISEKSGKQETLLKKEAFLKFVSRVEGIIERENASTLNVMTTVTEQKTENPGN